MHQISNIKKMNKNIRKKYLIPVSVCMLVLFGLIYYYFFSSFSAIKGTQYVYIDNNDNIDSVFTKLEKISTAHSMSGFRILANHSQYANHIRTGRYGIKSGDGALKIFRHLKNGLQSSLDLTIPSVRTVEKLASELSKKLMVDSTQILHALKDEATCQKYGYDTTTIACIFIPNTYDIYWNINPEKLLDRMQKESKKFWNADRISKAQQIQLTPNEVITLASIIDEETANNTEKPMVAQMYLNRLKFRSEKYPEGMPLQADPTIKFALKQFGLHRIYTNMLHVKSPFNTYTNVGLPPGPIRIPTVAGIDAVLNHANHDYLYMCAKEDFSGTHNFARTYEEHMRNAAKYANALNHQGIK